MDNTPETIAKDLRDFIVENFLFGREQAFSNNDSFIENNLIDSTGVLELVTFLSERYGIVVDDEEIVPENLDSINCVVQFIRSKQHSPA